MRRLLCLIVLLPGLLQQAWAQQSPTTPETISTYLTQRFGIAKQKAARITAAVTTAAEKYSLPPAVLLAIISIESRFRDKAHGANGATGLMQVVPSAHRNLLHHVADLTDPNVNIDIGSSILYGYMRAAGGDLDAAMKSYGGSTTYAQKIESRAAEFASLFDTAHTDPDAASGAVAVPAVFVPSLVFDRASVTSPSLSAASGAANLPALDNRPN